ncbi:MAG: hypothetical protein AAFN59_11990 [Pseudomonadota bacterium]
MIALRRTRVIGLCLITLVSVTACGRSSDSGFNPFGFLNRQVERESLMPEDAVIPVERRELVQTVSRLSLEPTLDGAQLRADGFAAGLGYYDASLIVQNNGIPVDGILTFQFRASPPFGTEAGIVTNNTRTLRTAIFLSSFDLAGVREIRVIAQTNVQTIRP